MKRLWIIAAAVLCISALLLSGCGKEEETGNAAGSEYWTVWPSVNFGSLEYEKLKAQPWNSGRCEATSSLSMAETESGYYITCDLYLYYADKKDLNTWLPVCTKAHCTHNQLHACDAHYLSDAFIIANDRIYSHADTCLYPEVYYCPSGGYALYSRALNGSDMRLEYINKDMLSSGLGGSYGGRLNAEYWIYNIANINPDGSTTLMLAKVSADGTEMLVNETLEEFDDLPAPNHRGYFMVSGEPSFNHVLLGDTEYTECRFKDGELYFTDLTDYYYDGRYLAGNTLRMFRKNDGYYDVNLETKEEVRVADVFLKNSESWMPLPNCIVESTLFYSTHDKLSKNESHAMAVFDGESWRIVKLPPELLESGKEEYLILESVTSDSIFFTYQTRKFDDVYLYRIPIQKGELALEYCGQIK